MRALLPLLRARRQRVVDGRLAFVGVDPVLCRVLGGELAGEAQRLHPLGHGQKHLEGSGKAGVLGLGAAMACGRFMDFFIGRPLSRAFQFRARAPYQVWRAKACVIFGR